MASSTCGYAFKRPEAQLLADLSVVENDLQHVIWFLEPIQGEDQFRQLGRHVAELHWTGALVRYARPFSTGVLRWDWKTALRLLDAQQASLHERMIEVRNGYIAHSVGEMEDFVPSVQVRTDENGVHTIQAVNCNHSRILCGSQLEIEGLVELATILLGHVSAAVRTESEKLMAIALAMGADEIVKAGMWRPDVDTERPRRPRKPFASR